MQAQIRRIANHFVLSSLCLAACARPPASVATSRVEVGTSKQAAPEPLRLVVQVTVDQLRSDLPERILSRAADGGFRRFYEHGVVYDHAHYAHAITETAPGHATLFTGAHPKEHGIIGNEWLSASGEPVFVVDDASTQLVGGQGTGASPHNLLLPTVGDALRAETQERALVFAVSEKDRGAVLPAGRTGKAFWLDDNAGGFVSSSYYMQDLPDWLRACAESLEVSLFRGQSWTLREDPADYTAADDLPSERRAVGDANVFPHPFTATDTRGLTRAVKRTPFADELVLDFVRELFMHEGVGRDDVPDLLAISFSSTDYVGHTYGPESREAEDNLLRLDHTLAALLDVIERRVGLSRTLVILSADHGISESPEWLLSQGKPAGRHDAEAIVRDLNRDLRTRLHVELDLVRAFVNPSIWLHEPNIAQVNLTVAHVSSLVAELLRAREGVAAAFVRDDVLGGRVDVSQLGAEGDAVARRVTASVHSERSGHVYIVPSKGWLLAADASRLTAMHGTPWGYDTHVPILVLAPGVAPQHVTRSVDPRAIAPTLARWFALSRFTSASGEPLAEVLPAHAAAR